MNNRNNNSRTNDFSSSKHLLRDKDNSLLPFKKKVGGIKQNCQKNETNESRSIVDYLSPNTKGWEDMVKPDYELKKNFEQNPIIIDPTTFSSIPELFIAVKQHAKRWQRLSDSNDSTIEHRLRCARRMMAHPVFPIDFANLTYQQFIAYMTYREDIEKAGHWALKNDIQAIQMFLTAYGKRPIDTKNTPVILGNDYWFYKLPHIVKHNDRIIPSPNEVHQIITYEYSRDPYTNTLFQTLFAHNFWIGWRVPSEICVFTLDDVDFDHGSIRITEPKKHYSTRRIEPDEAILTGKTRKSFKNYVDKWRPKVECSKSGNAFYLTPTGRPFTPRHLGHELSERGKQVFPAFQPYVSRHWNATAMLIRAKLESGFYDKHDVQKWLGHEKEETTDIYVDQAKSLFKKYPFDWIKRTLKFDEIAEGDSALKSKQRRKTSVSTGKSGEGRYGLVGI